MPIISHDEARIATALESAEAAFWADIVASYPEATSGDLSPKASMDLAWSMREAIVEWLQFNCDVPPPEPKVADIMLHRIEYNYEDSELELTDGDEEHIAYCISNGISEGELSTTVAVTTEKCIQSVRGYWKINNNPDA